ncbi:MAG: MarR family transcriptional regulator, partial [Candidatus Hadarchaeales archaeon]
MKSAVFFTLVLLLSVPLAEAQTFLQIVWSESDIVIEENSAQETLLMEYAAIGSAENASDTLIITGEPLNLRIQDNSGRDLAYEIATRENSTTITFSGFSLTSGERYVITLKFTKPVTDSENGKFYLVGYRWSVAPMLSKVSAKLPAGAKLLKAIPSPSSISSSNSSLNLKWIATLENHFSADISFQLAARPPPSENNNFPLNHSAETPLWILLPVAVIAAILGGIIAMLAFRRKVEIPPELTTKPTISEADRERIMALLSEPEKAVIKELFREDNLLQKTLCERTGIPKATMSRTLKRLEAKGLARRTGFGAGKRTQLTRWGKKLK